MTTRAAPKVRPFEQRLKRLDDADVDLLVDNGKYQLWRVQAKGSKDHHDIGVQRTGNKWIVGDCGCAASEFIKDPGGCVHQIRLLNHLKETETMTATTEITRPNGASAQADLPSYEVMEMVLGTGDIGRLSPQQRVEYYVNLCQSIGLNPMSRPFEFITFQGKVVPYVKKDATDQLRKIHNVNITLTEKKFEDGMYTVTAHAELPNGRRDESTGVVTIGNLQGEARANAYMKAESKAKRRVTLSICGLGFLEEIEVNSIAGQQPVHFNHTTGDMDMPAQHPVNQVQESRPENRQLKNLAGHVNAETENGAYVSEAEAKAIVKDLNDYINASLKAMLPDVRAEWQSWMARTFKDTPYKKLSIAQLAELKGAIVDAVEAAGPLTEPLPPKDPQDDVTGENDDPFENDGMVGGSPE